MTEREKIFLSERLFDEIGLIDDRFIYEASTPYRRKRKFGAMGRVLVIAAALSLTLCIIAGTLLTGTLFLIGDLASKDAEDGDSMAPPSEEIQDSNDAFASLSSRLEAIPVGTYSTAAKDDVELFDSKPKVVWEVSGEDECCVLEISDSQANALIKEMRSGGEKTSGSSNSNRESVRIWIVLGNGQVVTPHLELTAGNVGYGELFDYVQEYEPSENFSDLLIDTIS